MSQIPTPAPDLATIDRTAAEEQEFSTWLANKSWDGPAPEPNDGLRRAWEAENARSGIVRYSPEGFRADDYDPDLDDYGALLGQGFSHKEVQAYLGPRLAAAAFTDREIHEYFQQQAGEAVSYGRAAKLGFQHSWMGMASRGALPDALEPEEMAAMGLGKRLAMQGATLAGDLPPMAAGAVMGAATGPAAPVAIPAGAFAAVEGSKAALRERIVNGPVRDAADLAARLGHVGMETAKGMAIGAATGGAGVIGSGLAARAGATSAGQTAAKLGAETLAMPVTAAGLEGHMPTAQEFLDGAVLIAALHVGGSTLGSSGGTVMRTARDIAPKLENITAKIGKRPLEILKEAEADPTVKQDILSCNRDVPEAFKGATTISKEQFENLITVLNSEQYKDVNFGTLRGDYKKALNEIRTEEGQPLLRGDDLVVPSNVVKKLHEKRMLLDGMNANNIAELLLEVFHLDADLAASTRYPHIQALVSLRADLADIGFIGQNPRTGETVVKSVYTEQVGRLGTRLGEKEEPLRRDARIPSSRAGDEPNTVSGKSRQPGRFTDHRSGLSEEKDTTPAGKVNGSDLDSLARSGDATAVPVDPAKPVLPEGQLSVADTVKMSDIVADLEKALGAPIRTGKMGQSGKGALGIYKVSPEVIRTRVANDIATVVHEAGHHIQKQLFGSIDAAPLRAFRDELAPIATIPRSGQSPLPEGFAEYVAKYVVNPAEAARVAPRFTEHFQKLLAEQAPELKAALDAARDNVQRWADQPAALEVLSHISVEGREGAGLLAGLLQRDTWERVYTATVDRLYPLKKATELLAAGEELPAHMDPYVLARTFQGAKGKASHFIERSPFTFGTLEIVGKPLAETLRAVENMDEFRAYLVSRRGLEVEAQGKKAGPRAEAMRATAEALREKYEPLAKELGEYQDHLVAYLVDSGLVDAKAAAAMREMNKHYVPFFRVMEADGGFWGGGKALQGKNPVKRMKGSGRDIIDPIESVIKNTYAYIEAAEKNAVGKALVDLAARRGGSGWLVEKLPTPKEAVRVSKAEVADSFIHSLGQVDPTLRDSLAFLRDVEGMEGVATFWRNAQTLDKKSQIAVYKKGTREVFQVAPEIAAVMHDLSVEQVPLFVRLMAIPAKMLRAGATLTPDFMARNMIRDALTSGTLSRSGFIPGLDTGRGLKHAVTRDAVYWDWVKAGGDQASLVSMDRTTLQKTLKDITATGYPGKAWNLVKNPVEALRFLSDLSEQTTRLGEFARATAKHGTDKAGMTRAAYEARDLMDFARRGSMTKNWNIMTAFFNAQVQGLDRLARGLKENPRATLAKAAAYIAIPSIILAARNYGDERVKQVPRAQRDMFWIVPVGEGENTVLTRIPKPFELGVLFGSSVERATEFILDAYTQKYGGDINKARKEAFRGYGASLFSITKPSLLPNAVQPVIEAFANRSLTFDRPIIPKNREGMLPEYQYAPYTTELAKRLSVLVKTLPGVGEMNTFSPARAEHFVRAWTGGLGMYALQGLDALGRKTGFLPDPVKPADTLADMPFIKAFVVRHPSMGAESIQRFYDSYDEAQRYLKTINGLQKDFRYDDVANLMPYTAYRAIEGPRQALTSITRTIDLVYKDPSMTADDKRQLIDTAYFQAIEISRLGLAAFDTLKNDIEALKRRAELSGTAKAPGLVDGVNTRKDQ